MSTQLDQIAKKAKSNPKLRFTSLAHLLTPEFLTETWKQMNRRGASGVDGETTKEFEQGLDTRVQELCERLKQGAYRAPPVRRVEIPKGPGKAGTRPLGIPTVEDRLLQRAVARILEAVFEADFLECSYGFRPDVIPTEPSGRYAGSSSRRRLDTYSRRTSEATLTTSSMIGCRRWLHIGLQTRSSCA